MGARGVRSGEQTALRAGCARSPQGLTGGAARTGTGVRGWGADDSRALVGAVAGRGRLVTEAGGCTASTSCGRDTIDSKETSQGTR